MFAVNKAHYDADDVKRGHDRMANDPLLFRPSGRCYALCLDDAFETISFVLYMKERGGSVLLLPQQSPYGTARKLAEQAGCDALVYGGISNVVRLNEDARFAGEACLLQYSSGTTGEPKLIRRTWGDIDAELAAYNEALEAIPDEKPIVWVPVTHSFGLVTGVLAAMMRGSEPLIVTDKNPRYWLSLLKQHPRSIVYAVPFLLHLFVSFKFPVRFHRVIASGSPLTDALLEQLRESAYETMQQYGCSELGCISLARHAQASTDVGYLLRHLRLDDGGTMQSPTEWTVAGSRSEVRTRDFGYRDSSGRLHLLGRIDDLINVAGQKVIPYEVEQTLLQHPLVQEAVVCRTKHPVWGEAVKAFLVPRGHADSDAVLKWCIERLPPFKVPSSFVWLNEIPRNANGKVSRKHLENLISR